MLAVSTPGREIRDFVLLRYVLIIAVSYLIVVRQGTEAVSPAAAILVAAALGSNVLLGLMPPTRLRSVYLAGIIVGVDTLWLSLSLALLGRVSTEFFFLYFFVLFFAALSENLLLMLVGVVAASGAYLWVLTRLHPGAVWSEDHLLQITFLFSAALFYGVLVNRTRERRHEAELLEAADRERTQLLATVAHDIGGPAHVISFGIEALEQEIEPRQARVRPLLESIARNSHYMKQLAERFVEYSRLRAGRYELAPAPLTIAAVLRRVVSQHELDARARGVALTAQVAPMPPAVLDELALVRALSNLVANAIRYSDAGATVAIHAALADDGLSITVRDSGRGMAPERRDSVGKPFVAAADALSGSGLGLYIVRSLVEAQGGSLSTQSEQENGTAVTIRLPFVPATGRGAAEVATPRA